MAENGHGKTNGVHWTQTDAGRAKMALAQRKGWRKRRQKAKMAAAATAKATRKKKRPATKQQLAVRKAGYRIKKMLQPPPTRVNGVTQHSSNPHGPFTPTERKMWLRGLLLEGARTRLSQIQGESKLLERLLS